MIFLNPGVAPDPHLTMQPEAFLWWYLDLVGDQGEALVLIWAGGLPMLPCLKAGLRPKDDPSFNLVLYRCGRPDFYLLQRYAPETATWDGDVLQMGANRLGQEMNRIWIDVDSPVPGSGERIQGRIEVEGPRVKMGAGIQGSPGDHHWGPVLAPATGRADLRCGSRQWTLRGSAYHDRNSCGRPLNALGIDQWAWGRVSLGGVLRVWYLLWPSGGGEPIFLDISVDEAGNLTSRPARFHASGARQDLWGMPWWERLILQDPELQIRFLHKVDAGPYYLRFLVEARNAAGEVGQGVAEVVCPGRVELPWVRRLAATRVHTLQGVNSPMAGFFNGPSSGRIDRFLAVQRET